MSGAALLPSPSPEHGRVEGGIALGTAPQLLEGMDGAPPYAFSIFLAEHPDPVLDNVADLVVWAFASLRVSIAPRKETLARSTRVLGRRIEPAFYDRVAAALVGPEGRVFGRAASSGSGDSLSLRAWLDRQGARLLLLALTGSAELEVRVTASFRAGERREERAWRSSLAELLGTTSFRGYRLLYPDPRSRSGFREVDPLVRSPASRSRSAPAIHMLSEGSGRTVALPLALTPSGKRPPEAHSLLASGLVHSVAAGTWTAADPVADASGASGAGSIPVVEDQFATLWPDQTSSRRFYAPSFTLRSPAPTDPVETSAFAFTLKRLGATANPEVPALTAAVRFALDVGRSDVVTQALVASPQPVAVPTPLGNLSARLDVPFRDAKTGELQTQSFVGTVEETATGLTLTVEVLNDWARLLYGSLSYPGFQSEPARLRIAWAFSALVPIARLPLTLAYSGKLVEVPLAASTPARLAEHRPVLDVKTATVAGPGLRVGLEREVPPPRSGGQDRRAVSVRAMREVPSLRGAGRALPAALHAAVAIRPPMLAVASAAESLRKPRYVRTTIVREQTLDVSFDCRNYGGLYVEDTNHGMVPIGCSDVLKLGQLEYELYQELPEVAGPSFRLFRCLQQPGRFLVLPLQYRVTRYGPDEAPLRRYRPVAFVYAIVGDDPGASTYWFTATLEPNVPAHERATLLAALLAFTPAGHTPVLEFPSEASVNAELSFSWALPPGVNPPQVQTLGNALQVSVSTGLLGGVALKELIEHSGMRGSVAFKMADGRLLSSGLVMDTSIIGPWDTGPVSIQLEDGKGTLTNAILQRVDVGSVLVRSDDGLRTVPVGRSLEPGEQLTVDLGSPAKDAWTVTGPPQPATFEQLAVFEEDITTAVSFINQVSLANHGLKSLSVRARIKDSAREYGADLPDLATATLELMFPLTTYLRGQVLEFMLTASPSDGPNRVGAWRDWDLQSSGTVIGITIELLP